VIAVLAGEVEEAGPALAYGAVLLARPTSILLAHRSRISFAPNAPKSISKAKPSVTFAEGR
jgi:hypothetical protein